MRSLFAFALSSIWFFITVHIAGVGKRKVMQKGAFAYKGLRNVLVIKTYCKVSILKLVKCL